MAIDLPGGCDAQVLGRLRVVLPGREIVIEQDQPWRGQLRIKFERTGATQTRVRFRAQVPSEGIEWIARHRGASLPLPAPTGARRIGLLTSKSGSGAVYSMAAEYMAQLAVEQVNAGGGVDRRPVDLLIADDSTDHLQARRETVRLIEAGCRAIFACGHLGQLRGRHQGRRSPRRAHGASGDQRGGMEARKVIQFGERPEAQMSALSRIVERETRRESLVPGGPAVQLVVRCPSGGGQDPRRVGQPGGGPSASPRWGPGSLPPSSTGIRASGADVVMSSLVGADEVAFQQQAHEAGLRDLANHVSLVMDECTLEHVGPAAGNGIWTALNYFQSVTSPGNSELLRAYREHFGPWAPPLSSLSTNVYEAIRQYLELAALHPDAAPSQLAAVWRTRKSDRGQRRPAQHGHPAAVPRPGRRRCDQSARRGSGVADCPVPARRQVYRSMLIDTFRGAV